MNKLKIAVIGTGHLGSIHAKLWKNQQNVEFVGIYDIDTERSMKIASDLNCSYFESLDVAISASDAITIAVPTSLHFDISMKCINANKHCFIEKPITSTYEEASKLIITANEKGVLLSVGHVERFNPAIVALEQYSIKPLFIESHRLSQFKPRAIDVSVIHDLMIHDIDLVLWLVKSKVTSIDANGVSVLTDTTDIANVRLKFENGAVANLTASRISANAMRKMRIFQQDAYFSIDFGKPNVDVFRLIADDEELNQNSIHASQLGILDAGIKNKNIYFEKPEMPQSNAIAEEQRAFVDSIVNNLAAPVTAADAAEALRIVEIISDQIK